MSLRLVKFITDSDGPQRTVSINPEYVTSVEDDMAKPGQVCHISLVTGEHFRVMEPNETASRRLLYGL